MGSKRVSCDFPTGLRVLVVDRDYESLNKIERMLKSFKYAVMQLQYRIENSVTAVRTLDGPKYCRGELDFKFKKAVEQIGIDKATPKMILTLMGDPLLTRENISSRLQKFKIKVDKRAATLAQVFEEPADLHSQINDYNGHFFEQPFNLQNSQVHSSGQHTFGTVVSPHDSNDPNFSSLLEKYDLYSWFHQ